jgi:uncharacterized protein (TIGR00730 family)
MYEGPAYSLIMKSIVVYCGSSTSASPIFVETARELGRLMAGRSIHLVYGGGRTGLMGVVADAVLDAGGIVTGVIPEAMKSREIAHYGLTKLHIVENMHQRKAMMLDMAEGIIALPGGLGTLEEWSEAMTWLNLGYHNKRCGLLNVAGFYDPLLLQLDRMHREGFIRDAWMKNMRVAASPAEMLDLLV